nr:MAG TPA: hypothetical protein [Caudoviricetes sp.]
MTNEQYYELIKLAKEQLSVTESESKWATYIEGLTDMAYAMRDYDTMSRLDNRLWIMWNEKQRERME